MIGNKLDLILSISEILLEISGVGKKIAKMLKIILGTKYPDNFELLRRIKVFGIQIYGKVEVW